MVLSELLPRLAPREAGTGYWARGPRCGRRCEGLSAGGCGGRLREGRARRRPPRAEPPGKGEVDRHLERGVCGRVGAGGREREVQVEGCSLVSSRRCSPLAGSCLGGAPPLPVLKCH